MKVYTWGQIYLLFILKKNPNSYFGEKYDIHDQSKLIVKIKKIKLV